MAVRSIAAAVSAAIGTAIVGTVIGVTPRAICVNWRATVSAVGPLFRIRWRHVDPSKRDRQKRGDAYARECGSDDEGAHRALHTTDVGHRRNPGKARR